jgi:hypothetical protein
MAVQAVGVQQNLAILARAYEQRSLVQDAVIYWLSVTTYFG